MEHWSATQYEGQALVVSRNGEPACYPVNHDIALQIVNGLNSLDKDFLAQMIEAQDSRMHKIQVMIEAVEECIRAEMNRRDKLRPGSVASDYTNRRLQKLMGALATAKGEA